MNMIGFVYFLIFVSALTALLVGIGELAYWWDEVCDYIKETVKLKGD